MLVYRSTSRRVDVETALAEVAARIAALPLHGDHDGLRSLLIDVGELEAALVDRECPKQDDSNVLASAFDALLVRLAEVFVRSWDGASTRAATADCLRERLDVVQGLSSYHVVDVPVSEGFAFYGLFPETYVSATRALIAARAPKTALVVGIRSIGTTLSAVVAATLAAAGVQVERITLRPRGHPFDRELHVTDRLTREIRLRAAAGDVVAIVDEGPGISGSSFACVADFLSRLGVRDERIVFMPSWAASAASLRNERARQRWERHARFLGDFDQDWIRSGRLARHFAATIATDVSAGAWREHIYASPADYPPIHPQHERRKYLATRTNGEEILIKFEGLGRYGNTTAAFARRLASAGLGPEVRAHRDGFTATTWLQGCRFRQCDVTADVLYHVARYVAWRHRHERTGGQADPEPLVRMLELNVREGLGAEWSSAVRHVVSFAGSVRSAPAVRLDNRMMPHEWLRTRDGFIKTDSASHYDDHFYPGPHDTAWDLAGASMELGLHAAGERLLIEEYIVASRDVGIYERLPFMRAAYAAFRLGYATMAVESLGQHTSDGARMKREVSRYAAALRSALDPTSMVQLTPIEYGQSYATGT